VIRENRPGRDRTVDGDLPGGSLLDAKNSRVARGNPHWFHPATDSNRSNSIENTHR